MALTQQAENMVNDNGCILSCGFVGNGDRVQIVMPIVCDTAVTTAIQKATFCKNVVGAFETTIRDLLLNCIGSNAELVYTQAEGMIDGLTPYRHDYDEGEFPGVLDAGILSSQVATLIVFYVDPDDEGDEDRTAVGKNFIPFPPAAEVNGDLISDSLTLSLVTLADALQTGFDLSGEGASGKAYRICASPGSTPGTQIRRALLSGARGYVVTQKRRLIPR